MNKSYFNYLVKSKRHLILFVVIVNALIASIALVGHRSSDIMEMVMGGLTVVAYGFAGIMPMLLLEFVHSRKACDSVFALPIKRSDMVISIVAFAFFAITIPYALCTLGVHLLGAARLIAPRIDLVYTVCLIGTTSLGIITTVMFIAGLYLMANSVVDGFIVIGGYLLIPFFLYLASSSFITYTTVGISNDAFNAITRISLPAQAMNMMSAFLVSNIHVGEEIVPFIINALAHLAIGIFLVNKNFINRQSERAENISKSFFCYPFLLLFYSVIMTFMVSMLASEMEGGEYAFLAVLYLLIFTFYTIFTFIYKRKIEISLRSIITFALVIALTLSFSFAAYRTKGFGLVYSYPKNNTPIEYSYSEYGYRDDIYSNNELYGLLDERGIEVYNIEIWFDYTVWDREKDRELVDVMEGVRLGAIDNYYGERTYTGASLDVFNKFEGTKSTYDNVNHYWNVPALSLDEIGILSKYANIEINLYITDNYSEAAEDSPIAYEGEQWVSLTYAELMELLGE